MAEMDTCPRNGTEVELSVMVRLPVPFGLRRIWTTGHWDEGEHKWVYGPNPFEAEHPESFIDRSFKPDAWRPKGLTARITAKQASVGKKWVVTNGDPEFFEALKLYWVMPRGRRSHPLMVSACEVYRPDHQLGDLNSVLIGWTWDTEKHEQTVFTIRSDEVWAVRLADKIEGPHVQEPARYEEVA